MNHTLSPTSVDAQTSTGRGGLVIDTASAPPDERLSLWAETGRDLYGQLAFRRSAVEPFSGRISAYKVGPLQVVRTEAEPIMAMPVPGDQPRDGFTLKLNLYGPCYAGIAGRRIALEPGDLMLYDRRVLEYVDCQGGGTWGELDINLPWSLVQPYAGRLRRSTGIPFSGSRGVAGVLSRFLVELDATLQQDGVGHEDAYLADGTFKLVLAMCLREQVAHIERFANAHEEMLLKVKEYIEEHIGETDLHASTIARENFISVRLLYKLFESEGLSVGGWIKDRRLERCRQDLVDHDSTDQTISQIAYRWGFKSPAHFSRLFRSKLGVSPSEYRRGEHSPLSDAS